MLKLYIAQLQNELHKLKNRNIRPILQILSQFQSVEKLTATHT